MLVTNPQQRASLPDLLSHPWMTRGFNGSPDPHLLRREPLRADELERQVIHGMTGFEFGTEEDIEHRLVTILESDAYKRAVQHWETKRDRPQVWTESLSNSSLAIAWDNGVGGQAGVNRTEAVTPKKNKRFSGFDFYRRKLFSPASSPPPSPFASPSASQSQLSNASLSDFNSKEPPDPTRGYHPLISIYYLAREKLERVRVYGPGHFASSQLSLNPLQPPPEEVQAAAPSTPAKPPPLVGPPPVPMSQKVAGGADYSMRPSRLPPPESPHYSKMSYDAQVTAPSPTAPTFQQQQQQQQQPRPRARDAGLPLQQKPGDLVVPPPPPPVIVSDTTAAAASVPPSPTMPRAPPASTHRRSHSVSHRQGVPRGWASMFGGGSGGGGGGGSTAANEHGQLRVNVNGHETPRPRTAGPELTTFAEDEQQQQEAAAPEVVLLPATPTASPGATLVRKFGSLLIGGGGGGSGSIRGGGDRANKRTSILASFGSPRPSADIADNHNNNGPSEKEREKERKHAGSPLSEKTEAPLPISPPPAPSTPTTAGTTAAAVAPEESSVEMHVSPTGGISHSQTQPLHRRAATVLDPQGHAKRHERRSSTGGALLSSVTGTIGRHRRPSTGHGSASASASGSVSASATSRPSQGSERPLTLPEEDVVRPATARPAEHERDRDRVRVNGTGTTGHELTDGEDEANASAADKDFKPVFLKGLFRYVFFCVFSFSRVLKLICALCVYSVATTSTKTPATLKTDIRRVLDRMQVQYRETRTGFDCIHLPSIDISSLQDPLATPTPSPRKHRKQGSGGSGDSGGTTRRIARKASKLSFAMRSKDKDKDRSGGGEPSVMNGTSTSPTSYNKEKEKEREREREVPGRQSGGSAGPATTTLNATQSSGSSSFFNVSSNTPTIQPDDTLHPDDSPQRSNSPARSKNLPPIPRDFAGGGGAAPQQQHQPPPFPTGEVDREVFESVGRNTLSVRFEINIVKVRVSVYINWSFLLNASFTGAVVAITWYSVPSCWWRRMAVPDARTTSVDGAEALMTQM